MTKGFGICPKEPSRGMSKVVSVCQRVVGECSREYVRGVCPREYVKGYVQGSKVNSKGVVDFQRRSSWGMSKVLGKIQENMSSGVLRG